jgi:hypothetical protein
LLLALLAGCGFLSNSFDRSSYAPSPIPNEPRTYIAEYGKVWNSALDTLDYLGYVIAQMDKADGYITTGKQDIGSNRTKVSLRIVGAGPEVTVVKVNIYLEVKSTYTHPDTGATSYSWRNVETDGHNEMIIKDIIAEKIVR